MRKMILLGTAMLSATILTLSVQLGAQAYWQTTASLGFTVESAPLSISTTITPATITGASGTSYATLDVTNTGHASYALAFRPTRTLNLADGVTVTTAWERTAAGSPCSTLPPLIWKAVDGNPQGGVLQPSASIRMCVRITWSGATSLSDGSTVTINPAITGAITGTNWTVPTTPLSIVSTFTDGPAVIPPDDLLPAVCTPMYGGMLLNVKVPNAPAGSYRLRIGAADSSTYYGGASSGTDLASIGWTLPMGNFGTAGTYVLFVTEEGSTTAISQFSIASSGSSLQCGVGAS